MDTKKQEAMDSVQYEVNTIKDKLLTICYKLEEKGAVGKAKSLYTIVGRLEQWQHTR